MRHQIEATLERRLGKTRNRGCCLAGGVERHEHLPGLPVLDELDPVEAAETSHLANRRVLRLQGAECIAKVIAHRGGVLDDALLTERLDRGDGRRAGERMPGVGEAAGKEAVAHLVDDLAARDHGAKRHVARVDSLRDAQNVGHDVPVLAGKPLPGAPEPRHHLVEDQQDAVPVADLAHALEVAVRRDDDAVRAGDGLEDDRRNGVGALVLENLLEVRCAGAHRARVGVPGGAAVGVRVERAHDAGHARFDGPATGVAGQRDGPVGGAVVGAVPRDDLVAPGDHAGELDRILVGLGAAVREERD